MSESSRTKRRVVPSACDYCRKNKRKCSESRPCGQCVKRSIECVTTPRTAPKRNDRSRSSDRKSATPKRKRAGSTKEADAARRSSLTMETPGVGLALEHARARSANGSRGDATGAPGSMRGRVVGLAPPLSVAKRQRSLDADQTPPRRVAFLPSLQGSQQARGFGALHAPLSRRSHSAPGGPGHMGSRLRLGRVQRSSGGWLGQPGFASALAPDESVEDALAAEEDKLRRMLLTRSLGNPLLEGALMDSSVLRRYVNVFFDYINPLFNMVLFRGPFERLASMEVTPEQVSPVLLMQFHIVVANAARALGDVDLANTLMLKTNYQIAQSSNVVTTGMAIVHTLNYLYFLGENNAQAQTSGGLALSCVKELERRNTGTTQVAHEEPLELENICFHVMRTVIEPILRDLEDPAVKAEYQEILRMERSRDNSLEMERLLARLEHRADSPYFGDLPHPPVPNRIVKKIFKAVYGQQLHIAQSAPPPGIATSTEEALLQLMASATNAAIVSCFSPEIGVEGEVPASPSPHTHATGHTTAAADAGEADKQMSRVVASMKAILTAVQTAKALLMRDVTAGVPVVEQAYSVLTPIVIASLDAYQASLVLHLGDAAMAFELAQSSLAILEANEQILVFAHIPAVSSLLILVQMYLSAEDWASINRVAHLLQLLTNSYTLPRITLRLLQRHMRGVQAAQQGRIPSRSNSGADDAIFYGSLTPVPEAAPFAAPATTSTRTSTSTVAPAEPAVPTSVAAPVAPVAPITPTTPAPPVTGVNPETINISMLHENAFMQDVMPVVPVQMELGIESGFPLDPGGLDIDELLQSPWQGS